MTKRWLGVVAAAIAVAGVALALVLLWPGRDGAARTEAPLARTFTLREPTASSRAVVHVSLTVQEWTDGDPRGTRFDQHASRMAQ